MRRFIIFILLSFCLNFALASTVYVAHSKSVMLYDSPSSNANVIRKLPKGTPLELLKTNLRNGYSYVQTSKKEMGWMETSFLTDQETKPDQPNFMVRLWQKTRHLFKRSKPAEPTVQAKPQPQQISAPTLTDLQQQVAQLQKAQHSKTYWFFMGVIVMFIGMMIGFLLGGKKKIRGQWY